eukprot:8048040-Pyramimonas_sp.AAC.1
MGISIRRPEAAHVGSIQVFLSRPMSIVSSHEVPARSAPAIAMTSRGIASWRNRVALRAPGRWESEGRPTAVPIL